ncbi:MAG: phytanoyl-CoA dioxygenase family protein [Planctomycetota bacterium]
MYPTPYSDLFPRLESPAEAARYQLTAAQLDAYRENGFVGGIPILAEAECAVLVERLDWLVRHARELEDRLYEIELAWAERPGDVAFHCLGGWLVDEALHDVLFHPAVTVPAAQCIGVQRLRLWHDQIFAKPPHHPGVVPWHQDWSYWQRLTPPRHVTVHIALDDADEENGCIHYVPGSHRWEAFDRVPFGGDMDALPEALPAHLRQQFQPVPCRLRRGEGVLHHSHIVHGSYENRSDRPRRALALNFMAPDTRVADDSAPLLKGVPPIAAGEIVEGDHFPIVLDLLGVGEE